LRSLIYLYLSLLQGKLLKSDKVFIFYH